MPELSAVAEWLGVEVIDVEGEAVVRYRQQSGKWCERDQRATTEEALLYDAVRGLVGTSPPQHLLARVAMALGCPPGFAVLDILEKIAGLLADNRHWREKANGCDAELVRCRKEKADRIQAVEQLKADRWKGHTLSSAAYYRNDGEQNAFAMVLDLLKTGSVPL